MSYWSKEAGRWLDTENGMPAVPEGDTEHPQDIIDQRTAKRLRESAPNCEAKTEAKTEELKLAAGDVGVQQSNSKQHEQLDESAEPESESVAPADESEREVKSALPDGTTLAADAESSVDDQMADGAAVEV